MEEINNMKKIGITGQQGFIGKHLYNTLSLLQEEFELVEFERDYFEDNFKLNKFVCQCDIIVHLAAMNRHDDPQVIYDTNIELVKKLIKSMEVTNSKAHVVFSSSTQEKRGNLYGNSKKEGSELFTNWAEKNNSFFTSLIIPNVFGPYGRPYYNSFISTFCYQIQKGESPKITKNAKVNLIYIKDLVEEIKKVIKKPQDYNSIKSIPPSFSLRVSEALDKLNALKLDANSIEDSKINTYLKETLDSYKIHNQPKRIMILGASGMAGHVIYKYLDNKSEFIIKNISFRDKVNNETLLLDVRNFKELEKEISLFKPNFIINAIGILINGSTENPSNSILLNSYFPHFLSNISNKYNYKVIHLSTDCVFSGKSKGGYLENSFKDADDIYGRSKALGEIDSKLHLTIRTSIIGPELKQEGQGLLHWFLKQEGQVTGFLSAYWSGITTLQLAKVIYDIILKSNISGIHHITNNSKISKYDLLLLFKETWNKSTIIIKGEGKFVDKSFIDTMNVAKIPSYKDMLIELKGFMELYDKDFNYNKNYSL
jgi:dTDP-4-dehydrorhamnose reductase